MQPGLSLGPQGTFTTSPILRGISSLAEDGRTCRNLTNGLNLDCDQGGYLLNCDPLSL